MINYHQHLKVRTKFKIKDIKGSSAFTNVITYHCDVLIFDHTALTVATSFLVSVLLSAMCSLFTG